jgi:HSP20 family molecular chaperone IbpA
MSLLFPRLVQSEFAPVFRLLDGGYNQSFRSFQPRFDVQETKDGYKLEGEFPGFDQKDISIEFTDTNTLSIKGRSERHHEEGTRPNAQVEAPAEAPKAVESEQAADSETSSYHKASVEDESEAFVDVAKEDATPATTPAESAAAETETKEVSQEPKAKSRYWLSERSVGQFARTFTFKDRVDQEHVRASLKDGILSVIVPKAELPPNKRIEIQ